MMNQVTCRILYNFSNQLLEEIKKLEIENLGVEAAINEWQIPVIIRYGKFLVAEDGSGRILGVCEMLREWREEKTAFIHSFYTARGFRRRGIGRKLLQFAIDILKKESFSSVELTVDPENAAAMDFYKSFGFRVIEKRKNEYGEKKDRLLIALELG